MKTANATLTALLPLAALALPLLTPQASAAGEVLIPVTAKTRVSEPCHVAVDGDVAINSLGLSAVVFRDGNTYESIEPGEGIGNSTAIAGRHVDVDELGNVSMDDIFLVNNQIFHNGQEYPEVAATAADQFAAAWRGTYDDNVRYVSTATLGMLEQAPFDTAANSSSLYRPDVATSPLGDEIVVWTLPGNGSGDHLLGSLDGGPSITLDDSFNPTIVLPHVAMGPGGDFAVVWGDQYDAYIRTFDANGTPLSGTAYVTDPTNRQFDPMIAALPDGGYVVAWYDLHYGYGIRARVFDIDGTPRGPRFMVATPPVGMGLDMSSIVSDPWGRVLVAWREGSDLHRATFIDANAQTAGEPFLLLDREVDYGIDDLSVAIGHNDDVSIVWMEQSVDYCPEYPNPWPEFYGVYFQSFQIENVPE